jgi:hypothetical protein
VSRIVAAAPLGLAGPHRQKDMSKVSNNPVSGMPRPTPSAAAGSGAIALASADDTVSYWVALTGVAGRDGAGAVG